MTTAKYIQTLIFFALAFTLTLVLDRFLPDLQVLKIDVKTIITGFGPLISGLFCYRFFKNPNQNQISLGGVKPTITYTVIGLSVFLPILLMAKVSTDKIICSFITQFIYSFGEEFGWRHYLQNLTSEMNKWLQCFYIGIIWFFWHYAFSNNPVKLITGQNIPQFIGIPVLILILSLLSFLWGDLTIKTKSIFMPTVAHAITKYSDSVSVLIIVIIMLLLQIFWNKFRFGQKKISGKFLPL